MQATPTASRAASLRRAINPHGEGDDFTFCGTCAFAPVCLPSGYDKQALAALHLIIQHVGPYPAGTRVFRANDPFQAVYAVRAGAMKTSLVDDQGREQVLGFHLPGELVGLNAIWGARYPCDAIALDNATLCRFTFSAITELAARVPDLQQQLFRLMSKDIVASSQLGGDFGADERLAGFLIGLSRRYAERGYSRTRFHLPMSRGDIANYLRLAPETVSRVLRRFQDERMIRVDRRELELLAPERVEHLGRCVLRN
jgi:CRP/FNR family transcriptional regulator